jgi:hypothetical protein
VCAQTGMLMAQSNAAKGNNEEMRCPLRHI